MRVDLFDYELPQDRIARHPVHPRDAARLLDLTGSGQVDRRMTDLPAILKPGDLLVFNDTRVIPARLFGRRGEAKVEVTLHKREGPGRWRAFARPARKLKTGDRIRFADDLEADVAAKGEAGELTLAFGKSGADLLAALHDHGAMPLPPYIKRPAGGDPADRQDYQTIFAAVDGAVAAPTAGLHFTEQLLARLDAAGVERVALTLHVGAGTFLPVKVDDTDNHAMHAEWGQVSPLAAEMVAHARDRGGRVVAVGSTSLRLLESASDADGTVHPFEGDTDLFIVPGYRFKVADLMLTNFHLPRSTLLMLVSAFAGRERILAAYAHAIAAGYRFYSYGDACLLERAPT